MLEARSTSLDVLDKHCLSLLASGLVESDWGTLEGSSPPERNAVKKPEMVVRFLEES